MYAWATSKLCDVCTYTFSSISTCLTRVMDDKVRSTLERHHKKAEKLTKDVRKHLQRCLDEGKHFNIGAAIKSNHISDGLKYSLATGNCKWLLIICLLFYSLRPRDFGNSLPDSCAIFSLTFYLAPFPTPTQTFQQGATRVPLPRPVYPRC